MPTAKPSLWEMGRAFLLIGTFAFGGQAGLIALLNRDLVERSGWLTETDIAEAFTYVQILPGAVVVQVVAYLGWKLRGAWGTTIATTAFLFPSLLVMLVLGVVYQRIAELTSVRASLGGLVAAVTGVIAVATWKQGRKTITDLPALLVAVVVCVVSLLWHTNPALLVITAGLIGIVREMRKKPEPAPEDAVAE